METDRKAGPSWSDIEEATRSDAESSTDPTANSPIWHYDDTIVTDFGPYTLDDDIAVVECADCNRPILREALSFHNRNCKLARDIAEGRTSPSILEGELRKRRLLEEDEESVNGDDISSPLTKKQRKDKRLAKLEEKKKGGRKNKGPIDVDKQCGVINDKGLPCSRSLTCKSHSMGAKRSVEGRSAPYDTLLFEWQKATNPSFVAKLEEKEKATAAAKAAAAAAPPKEKKKKTANKDGKGKSGPGGTLGGTFGGAGGAAGGTAAGIVVEDDEMDMFDTGADEDQMDHELFSLLGAIANAAARDRTTPLPLATRSFAGCYTSRAKRMRNLRELLRDGLASDGGAYGINGYASWTPMSGSFTSVGT